MIAVQVHTTRLYPVCPPSPNVPHSPHPPSTSTSPISSPLPSPYLPRCMSTHNINHSSLSSYIRVYMTASPPTLDLPRKGSMNKRRLPSPYTECKQSVVQGHRVGLGSDLLFLGRPSSMCNNYLTSERDLHIILGKGTNEE